MTGAIVHEWIESHGGAEKVVDRFAEIFPSAPIYCLWDDTHGARLRGHDVHESWLSRTRLRHNKAAALPLMPLTWRHVAGGEHEWLLVSSHLFAHQVRIAGSASAKKIVYVHTPARYIWAPEHDQRGRHPLARLLAPTLKAVDRRRASEPELFIANSRFVRERVRSAWRRDAEVIYPPVDVKGIQAESNWCDRLTPQEADILDALPDDFLLGASRFVPYKRLDLVITAGEEADVPVVLAGDGPQFAELESRAETARVPTHIVRQPSDAMLYALYQRALVYVFPPIEDFGIMPIEAMAAGAPTVVNWIGGAREGVEAIGGGATFDERDRGSLRRALETAARMDRGRMRDAARQFDTDVFDEQIRDAVNRATRT